MCALDGLLPAADSASDAIVAALKSGLSDPHPGVRKHAVRKPWADPQPPMAAAESDKKAEIAAVRLLARREHGTRELKRKLAAKGHGGESVDRVVEKLGAESLVSDERFVSTFISYHAGRGHGPVRIKAELRQRGVLDAEIIEADDAPKGDRNWSKRA